MDITGQKFGRLTAICIDHKGTGKSRHTFWKCICDCGNETIVSGNSLRGLKTLSCGCLHKEVMKENHIRKFIDLTGQKIGRLLVKSRSDDYISSKGYKRTMWLCLCDCGNEKIICSSSLISGDTKSCGCYAKEQTSKATKKEFGLASFNNLFNGYRQEAKRRNLEFKIDEDLFKLLSKQKCFYCGCEPYQVQKNLWNNGNYIYNGIDRLDSNKGYIKDNVVPCCGQCNRSKSDLPLTDFINWVKSIYLNFNCV